MPGISYKLTAVAAFFIIFSCFPPVSSNTGLRVSSYSSSSSLLSSSTPEAIEAKRRAEYQQHRDNFHKTRRTQHYKNLMLRKRLEIIKIQQIDLQLQVAPKILSETAADENLFNYIDLNRDGVIDKAELIALMKHHRTVLE